MKNSGKWVVLSLLALAVCAALGAVWFQFKATHRALEHWGVEGSRLIRSAPDVRLFILESDGDKSTSTRDAPAAPPRWSAAGGTLVVHKEVDLSRQRGLVNLRTALLADDSFQWDRPAHAGDVHWEFALTFSQGDLQKTLVFSLAGGSVSDLDQPATVVMSEKLTAGLAEFLLPHRDEID
jgi:hypothetical protein